MAFALGSVAVRVVEGVGNDVDLCGEFKHSVPGSSKHHLGVGGRGGLRGEMNSQYRSGTTTDTVEP